MRCLPVLSGKGSLSILEGSNLQAHENLLLVQRGFSQCTANLVGDVLAVFVHGGIEDRKL